MIDLGIDGPLLSRRDAIDDGDPNPRGENLAHLSIIFVCLAGFFVILRLLTRHFHTKAFGADDVLIVVALVWMPYLLFCILFVCIARWNNRLTCPFGPFVR